MAGDGQNEKTYSAKQVASRIGTDAKQFRKFIRDPKSGYVAVGQGGRYDFPESELPKLQKAFDEWNSTKTRRNRQSSAERNLATAAGLIPGQRKDSPTPQPRRSKDNKEGLHGNALDNDTLRERFAGIAARVERHGLTVKQGRFVPRDPVKVLNPYPPKDTIPGLTQTPEPQILDFTDKEDRDPTDEELEGLFADDFESLDTLGELIDEEHGDEGLLDLDED